MSMPYTRPMEDLQNYEEISERCHRVGEPVILTKDEKPDLTIMSIETYERLFGPADLNTEKE